jgi:hypothetical protein
MTSNVTAVRWKSDLSRRCHVFEPLGADHPAVAATCVFCLQLIGTTAPVQLVAIGPFPDDDEAQEKHEAGRWYSAAAIVVHRPCVGALDNTQLEQVICSLEGLGYDFRPSREDHPR